MLCIFVIFGTRFRMIQANYWCYQHWLMCASFLSWHMLFSTKPKSQQQSRKTPTWFNYCKSFSRHDHHQRPVSAKTKQPKFPQSTRNYCNFLKPPARSWMNRGKKKKLCYVNASESPSGCEITARQTCIEEVSVVGFLCEKYGGVRKCTTCWRLNGHFC